MRKERFSQQVNVRLDDELKRKLTALRRMHEPIPPASDIMREALLEKYERDVGRGTPRKS